jgi:hypothetical protein
MALSVRHVGTRVLLNLALAAALLAGIVATGWVMGQAHMFGIGAQPQYMAPHCVLACVKTGSEPGGDLGGGH